MIPIAAAALAAPAAGPAASLGTTPAHLAASLGTTPAPSPVIHHAIIDTVPALPHATQHAASFGVQHSMPPIQPKIQSRSVSLPKRLPPTPRKVPIVDVEPDIKTANLKPEISIANLGPEVSIANLGPDISIANHGPEINTNDRETVDETLEDHKINKATT
jgi:hypothetical protein